MCTIIPNCHENDIDRRTHVYCWFVGIEIWVVATMIEYKAKKWNNCIGIAKNNNSDHVNEAAGKAGEEWQQQEEIIIIVIVKTQEWKQNEKKERTGDKVFRHLSCTAQAQAQCIAIKTVHNSHTWGKQYNTLWFATSSVLLLFSSL